MRSAPASAAWKTWATLAHRRRRTAVHPHALPTSGGYYTPTGLERSTFAIPAERR
ncbi:hypothetical protein [Amorphus sp. MBR-141]